MGAVDHFAALGLPRMPAIDPELVRQRFHELSRELHPDAARGSEEDFAAINEAQRVLLVTSARLRHLLELESGEVARSTAGGAMDDLLMALFAEVGDALSQADRVIEKRDRAGSAIARALLAGEEIEAQQQLMAAGGRLSARRAEVEAGLGALDLQHREEIAIASHELAFLEKWQRQLQERMGRLA